MSSLKKASRTVEFTRDEMYGRPGELVLWVLFIFGVPLMGLEFMERYPLLADNTPILWIVGSIVAVLTSGYGVLRRSDVVPWGDKAPRLMWLTLVSVGVYMGGAASVLMLGLNGALDRSTPVERSYQVIENRDGQHEIRVASLTRTGASWVGITEGDYGHIRTGDDIVLLVRAGFLGIPWIYGYRVPDDVSDVDPRP